MGSLSKVQACNLIRSASGLAPISTTAQDPKVSRILDLAVLEMSGGTQAYNTNKTTLEPNSDDKIDVSEFVSFVLPPQYKNLVEKNGFLWDADNEEYFSESISDVLVTSLPQWDNITLAWQYAIASRAACNFLAQYKGYGNELAYWERRAYEYLCKAEIDDPASMGKITGVDDRLGGFGGI